MRFTTKTEYGLVCLIYMARKDSGHRVTVKNISETEKFSPTYVEKILQRLKKAGIVHSLQGKEGGYVLSREASEISLKAVVEALEGGTFDIYCRPSFRQDIVCTHHTGVCGVKPIWWKTKEILDEFYGKVSIRDLAEGKLPEVCVHVG